MAAPLLAWVSPAPVPSCLPAAFPRGGGQLPALPSPTLLGGCSLRQLPAGHRGEWGCPRSAGRLPTLRCLGGERAGMAWPRRRRGSSEQMEFSLGERFSWQGWGAREVSRGGRKENGPWSMALWPSMRAVPVPNLSLEKGG